MIPSVQYKIKSNPNLQQYLRENSHWYKELNRDPKKISLMEEEMKTKYKLTTGDKINKIKDQITLISSFMDMLG